MARKKKIEVVAVEGPMSVNDRKAAERERMRAAGLRRFEAWVHPSDAEAVRGYVNRANAKRGLA